MKVWLLVSAGVLTGDTAADGADLASSRARAFASREAAMDALREFMRPDVADSRPEGAWDGDAFSVDDALDEILDNGCCLGGTQEPDGLWTWDGSVRSYEWKLVEQEVET